MTQAIVNVPHEGQRPSPEGLSGLASKHRDENECVRGLLARRPYARAEAAHISRRAVELVKAMRESNTRQPLVDTFLKEYGLSNQEGVALMCLAESLLRVPDSLTADQLIADKIGIGDWKHHVGKAEDLLVNVSTWGLVLTGNLISVDRAFSRDPFAWLQTLAGRVGEPVIRKALQSAMFILGKAFVLGRDMPEALARSSGGLYSYDMLGEAARDTATAEQYFLAYADAIRAVGSQQSTGSSISIKLSALHPRFEESQRKTVLPQLQARLTSLCELAMEADVAITIDAEEADRLRLTLDLFQAIARDQRFAGWDGFGIVVQAYSKRALPALEELVDLARSTRRCIPVRLVKGAYWDAEIKHAQADGLSEFPVFTRKENSDLSYLVCADFLLSNVAQLFPQFATHNAHTIAALMHMGDDTSSYEFQRLHGMGEQIYAEARKIFGDFPAVRTYAPVGGYRELLAYLVRRLLENGANSSFVNRVLDSSVSAESLCQDPIDRVESRQEYRHPRISLPSDLFGVGRKNSRGVDLNDPLVLGHYELLAGGVADAVSAHSIIGGIAVSGTCKEIRNPSARDSLVGGATPLPIDSVNEVFRAARSGFERWNRMGSSARAEILLQIAASLEESYDHFLALLVREAGKTFADAVAELREAVDFCRYYANQATQNHAGVTVLPGPTGERNCLVVAGRGVFVAISPWNFPLAIFTGQIAAALVMGNAVIAKPAEETPLVASEMVALMHRAGVPADVLQLALGGRELGHALVTHPSTAGVVFTGSTAAARNINRALAARDAPIVPLIAETGGQNAMFVDSTALLEQVTDDVISSAFRSAGQRCSALRILYLQEEIADEALRMITGAMDELVIGDPARRETDVGPVISPAAVARLEAHVQALLPLSRFVYRRQLSEEHDAGSFFPPTLLEIDHIGQLHEENFGPVLHVIRFAACELEDKVRETAQTGYGLTMGLHSRIEGRWQEIFDYGLVGNFYVNRDMVGAVVGSQPFGGQGLSGTGPKAGGPNYLMRFAVEHAYTINTVATGGNAELLNIGAMD